MVAQPAVAGLSEPPPPIESYVGDPGNLGDPASWRTPEFLRDNLQDLLTNTGTVHYHIERRVLLFGVTPPGS